MEILLLILNIILVLFNSYIYYKLCLFNDELNELYDTCYCFIGKEFKLKEKKYYDTKNVFRNV